MADPPWWRRRSLRARLVMVATVAIAGVLVAGWLPLRSALRSALVDELGQSAALRAHDLAALAAEGRLPSPVPVADADEALVQVVVAGAVAASSSNAVGLPPLQLERPPVDSTVLHQLPTLPVTDDQTGGFIVAARTVTIGGGPATVYVASSLEDVEETLGVVGNVVLIGSPVLVGVLAVVMWWLVGRTLAPVEAIRSEADEISGRDLHRRVSQPAAEDEIGRLASTLNRMLDRLENASDQQRRFVADAAHELRTPLATVRARLETARAATRETDWDDVSSDLLAETTRMQRLTEQLLLLARADAGRLTASLQPVDLDDLVIEAVAAYREGQLEVDLSLVQPVQLRGDRVLLDRAICNLIENALQHADARIVVSLTRDGADAILTVDDDGPGIPPDQHVAVFERFTRLDQARVRDRGGAGLGLAIVADIVAAHDGTVSIRTGPLGGTGVELRLPIR